MRYLFFILLQACALLDALPEPDRTMGPEGPRTAASLGVDYNLTCMELELPLETVSFCSRLCGSDADCGWPICTGSDCGCYPAPPGWPPGNWCISYDGEYWWPPAHGCSEECA